MQLFFISQSIMSTCPLPARIKSLSGPTLTTSSPGFSVVNAGPLFYRDSCEEGRSENAVAVWFREIEE
jgi:hypothetical protein